MRCSDIKQLIKMGCPKDVIREGIEIYRRFGSVTFTCGVSLADFNTDVHPGDFNPLIRRWTAKMNDGMGRD